MKHLTNEKIPLSISNLRLFSQKANSETLNLGLGKPYIDAPLELKDLICEVAKNSILEYSSNQGSPSLREAIEQRLKIPRESLVITNGAQEALYLALGSILNPQDEVLISDPGFVGYAPIARMFSAEVTFYKLMNANDNFNYDLNEIRTKVSAKTKAVILGDLANPTGSVFDELFFSKLIELAHQYNFFIIVDEVYSELSFQKQYRPACLKDPFVITINSLSKSHALTGMRIGYLGALNKDIISKATVLHQYMMTCANRLSQNLAEAILKSDHYYVDIINHFKNYYKKSFEIFVTNLNKKIVIPQGSFYLFLKLPEEHDVAFCSKVFEEQNLLMIPGSFFGEQGKGYARLALSLEYNQISNAALKLKNYLP